MKIVYKNVDSSSLSILDQWIIDKNSDIVKYAMFDYSFTSYEKILKENICDAYNLGTGKGYSVLELVNAFSKVNNIDVKYKITDRRPGDIDACYADTSYALKELNFKTTKTIEEMCKDSYNFILKNK